MPRFDGTGPRGEGPFTGRGEGYCVIRLPDEGNESAVSAPAPAAHAEEGHIKGSQSRGSYAPMQPRPRMNPWSQGRARAWPRYGLWQPHRMERFALPYPGKTVRSPGARRRALRRFGGGGPLAGLDDDSGDAHRTIHVNEPAP